MCFFFVFWCVCLNTGVVQAVDGVILFIAFFRSSSVRGLLNKLINWRIRVIASAADDFLFLFTFCMQTNFYCSKVHGIEWKHQNVRCFIELGILLLLSLFSYLFRFVGRCTIFFVAALLKIGRRPNNAVPTNQYSFHFIHFEVLFVWLIR